MLIIGYGNRLRGDDAVGWAAAETLMERRPEHTVLAVHTLTPELVADVAMARVVVFVDARIGEHPGRVHVERLVRDGDRGVSNHGLSPAALLDWTSRLFGRRPRAYLVTVEGRRFDFGEALSPDVERALPEALAAIDRLARGERASTRAARRESRSSAAC